MTPADHIFLAGIAVGGLIGAIAGGAFVTVVAAVVRRRRLIVPSDGWNEQ